MNRTQIAGILMTVLMVVSVATAGMALGASSGAVDGPDTGAMSTPATPTPTPTDDTDDGNETESPANQTDDENRTDDNETRGPPGNETGMPAGVESFTATSPLSGDRTDPSSLAGKLRVESEHAPNTTVELVRNSSTNFTLAINVTGNATNVTFYLQETAFAASQNLSNVSATLDGEPLALGREEASNSSWIGFEIDHFSTRTVTFQTNGTNDTSDTNETTDPTENETADNETSGPPGNVTGMPPGVESFISTSPLSGAQADPPSLAGKLRVESQYADNTTVELVRNSSTDFTLAVNVTGGAENVTFYLQETAFAASQNLSNVSATLDGEPLALGTTEAQNSSWIGFEIDHFSTRNVTFQANGTNVTDTDETNETDETDGTNETDETNETDTNGTDTNETRGPPGNVTGMPAGVESFTATSPLSGAQADPSSLAGKLRVESQYADNITVELIRNSSTNFSLAITGDENATNVTFYLQETAFAASQNLSNVSATLDGEPLALGTTQARGSGWIGFEIDHFSTRTVTFQTDDTSGTNDTGDGTNVTGPPALPGASNAPIDGDGDGVYEDVNGDGDVTPGDATVLFNAVFERSPAVMDNPGAFDFSGDGSVTVGDASVLFDSVFA